MSFFPNVFEEDLCFRPIFPVQAILNFGGFDLSLDKSGIFQLLQVLGEGGFGDGKFFGEVAAVAARLPGKEFEYINTHRMSQRLGDSGQAVLLFRKNIFVHIFLHVIDK